MAGANTGAVGVIVCDHGSRRENANTMLFEVAERYRNFSGFQIVEVGYLRLIYDTHDIIRGCNVVTAAVFPQHNRSANLAFDVSPTTSLVESRGTPRVLECGLWFIHSKPSFVVVYADDTVEVCCRQIASSCLNARQL